MAMPAQTYKCNYLGANTGSDKPVYLHYDRIGHKTENCWILHLEKKRKDKGNKSNKNNKKQTEGANIA